MSLAIGLNLLPVFLTTLSTLYGGAIGLTQEQLGRLGAAGFCGLAVAIALTGPLADRWGAKPFVQAGNVIIALSLVALAFAPAYAELGVAMFALGFGAGVLDMVLSPVVAALNPTRRSAAMNWLHSFFCVGAVATALLGTFALKVGLGWRDSCLLLTPLPLFLVIAFAPLRFPSLIAEGARTPFRVLVRDGWFLGALAALLLGGATEAGLAQWLPAYAERGLGFAPWIGGLALLLFSVAMALGRMIVGAAGPRLNSFHVMVIGAGLSTVLILVGAFIPSPTAALVACIVAGFTGSCLWPTMLAVTADRFPNGGATAFAALAVCGNAGGIFMPWLVGWVADARDLHVGMSVSAAAPLLLIPLVARLGRAVVRSTS